MISIEEVHKLVSIFYQPEFKTFYVNSSDGEKFTMPSGVFVSLGITTSMEVLKSIRGVINTGDEYSAELVEIVSKRIAGTQYMNSVTRHNLEEQYKAKVESPENTLDELGAKKELERLGKIVQDSSNDFLDDNIQKVIIDYNSLKKVVEKLDHISGGWDNHRIVYRGESGYGFYHLLVNYEKRNDLEYRVGIYVTQKNEGRTT